MAVSSQTLFMVFALFLVVAVVFIQANEDTQEQLENPEDVASRVPEDVASRVRRTPHGHYGHGYGHGGYYGGHGGYGGYGGYGR